ncbi:MAG TPA: tyrosinase family protein [Candidatus Nanopelagicales bacterium]|nr:tyrosinase family protein [Candidatus Nanopelagicales bacterium]
MTIRLLDRVPLVPSLPALSGALAMLLTIGCAGDPDGTIPTSTPDPAPQAELRVRRSWTSLSAAERRQFADGVVALKQKAALRWDYTSYCEGEPDAPARNAYDYFVESHLSAFLGHSHHESTDAYNRPHMGPQFLPWHREYLLRFEEEMRVALGDPDYMVPYWDWSAPPEEVFSTADLGDLGACPGGPGEDFGEVSGYLADQGYEANVYDVIGDDPSQAQIVCTPKKLTRGSGCFALAPTLPTGADVARALSIPTYDVAPYDNLGTDEDLSFRQNLEGFTNEDVNEASGICKFAGCRMHGQVHMWVGGLLGSAAAPNDPVFFMHHANVDRIWAEWQDRYGDATYPSTAPDDYSGGLFMFNKDDGSPVEAREMFDHRALGYRYDTQE